MKKICIFLFALLLVLVLVGCGEKVTLTINDSDKAISLEEGQSKEVVPVVTGKATLEWESSDASVATVNNGLIKAEKAGSAVITVYVKDDVEIKATITVTVTKKYEIKVTEKDILLEEGQEQTIKPSFTEGEKLVWNSSDSSIATVVDGKITAVKEGTAKITVYLEGHEDIKAEINVTVSKKPILVNNISINYGNAELCIGETDQLSYTVSPEDASSKDIEWSVTPSDVASIDVNGVLTALKAGNATVKASAKDSSGVYSEFQIIVYNVVADMELSGASEMKVGESQMLKLKVNTENTKESFTWSSSDESIATVSESGLVSAIGAGKVTIKVVSNDSGKLEKSFDITIIKDEIMIDDKVYGSLSEALAAAKEGDTIVLPAGNYNDPITIKINNLTIVGPNKGVNPAKANRKAEATFGAKITIASGVSGFTIDGVEFNGSGAISLEDKVSNVKVQYNVFTKTSQDGVVRGPASGEVQNISICYNYSSAFSSYRFGHFASTINGLELIGNELTCTSAYDFLNVGGMIKGEVVINNNKYINSMQSFLYVSGVGAMNCIIKGNYVEGTESTVVDFRAMKEDGDVKFLIENNEFNNTGTGWGCIRIRSAEYGDGDSISIEVKDNKFIESHSETDDTNVRFINNPAFDAQSDPFKKIYIIGKNYYEVDGQPYTTLDDKSFGGAAKSFDAAYATEAEVPGFEDATEINPTGIEILNKVDKIEAYSDYLIEFNILPADTTNLKVGFKSSDTSVATVSSAGLISARAKGTCTITAYTLFDENIKDEFTITIQPKERVEIRYDGTGVLEKGETLGLEVSYEGIKYTDNYVVNYTSSNSSIATVDSTGTIKAVGAGEATITCKVGNLEAKVTVTVVDEMEKMNELLQLLIEGNNGVVLQQYVMYIGSDDGSGDFEHLVYGSVNDFWNGVLPAVTRNMLSKTAANFDGRKMKSIEFIVFHDTAGAPSGSTAKANSGWCNNPTNTGSSWQYTIGNDGIYQQMEDDDVAWHAGDGASWAESTTLYDTGIKADPNLRNRAKVTLGTDGYFYVNGEKSLVPLPAGATAATGMNELGVAAVVKDGNYHIPTTHVGSGYGQKVCIRGGNLNGIGIESCVNSGSDVYLTWQYSAKFIAQLLIKHNMTPERVLFHNNFSNKHCPNTMMTANLVDTFLDMVYMEYYVAKNFADYEIKFESHNPDIIDNSGRIVGRPKYTTNVSYTITVSKDGKSQSVKLNALVPGTYN